MRTALLLLLLPLAACAPEEPRPAGQAATTSVGDDDASVVCVDEDRDGLGEHCVLGPDCDDRDPNVRDECIRCREPAWKCPCTAEPPQACDVDTDGPTTPATCHPGQRSCVASQWTHCEAYAQRFE